MFPKSIRWRLQAWQGFLLASILAGFGVTAFELHRTNELKKLDEELGRRIAPLANDVRGGPPGMKRDGGPPFDEPPGAPPLEPGRGGGGPRFEPGRDGPGFDPGRDVPMRERGPDFRGGRRGRPDGFLSNREIRLSLPTSRLFEDTSTNSFYYGIWSRSGALLKVSTNAPADLTRPKAEATPPGLKIGYREEFREAHLYTDIGECVLVGRSIAADLAGWRRFGWLLAISGLGVLVLGLGGGWLLTTRALRPVSEISNTASRIADGNLAERINVEETDSELGRLAGVLNNTFARLEASFAQQKLFTADASHELRTPLAVIISEAQMTLARQRSAAEYRETVETCLGAAQQMRRLAQSLLELARYDAGQEAIEHNPVDLAVQAQACVTRLQTLARERGLRVHSELAAAPTQGDADRLDQVITNLLANAIHYTREQGEIRITTRTANGFSELEVADNGPGIAPDDLPHIFERFYRADKARARAEGRAGLGLAICKAIVEAHGGTITAKSQPDAGASFTFRLPAG